MLERLVIKGPSRKINLTQNNRVNDLICLFYKMQRALSYFHIENFVLCLFVVFPMCENLEKHLSLKSVTSFRGSPVQLPWFN